MKLGEAIPNYQAYRNELQDKKTSIYKQYKKTKEIFVDAVFHEAVGEFAPVGHVLFQAFVHSDAKFVLPTKIRKKLLPLKSETLKITARQDEQGEIYPAGGHHSRPGARVAGLSETNL